MAVLQMPDIFDSSLNSDEHSINFPGKSYPVCWVPRLPGITLEDLLQELNIPSDTNANFSARELINRLRTLAEYKFRNNIQKQLESASEVVITHPQVSPGSKQTGEVGQKFLIDALVFGHSEAQIELADGTRLPMSPTSDKDKRFPKDLKLWRTVIPIKFSMAGKTYPFRIVLDGIPKTDWGYLVALSRNTSQNPSFKEEFGKIIPPNWQPIVPKTDLNYFQNLFNTDLLKWISEQRWFKEKGSTIDKIEVVDFLELDKEFEDQQSFFFICKIHIQDLSGAKKELIYNIPLTFVGSFALLEAAEPRQNIITLDRSGSKIYVASAENTLSFQRSLIRKIFTQEQRFGMNGGQFEFAPARGSEVFDQVSASRSLVRGTTNTLSLDQIGSTPLVVKSFKSPKEETEIFMYEVLQGFPGILPTYGSAFYITGDGQKIPLCLVIKKNNGPPGWEPSDLSPGTHIWNNFLDGIKNYASAIKQEKSAPKIQSVLEHIYKGDNCGQLINKLAQLTAQFHNTLANSQQPGMGLESSPSQNESRNTIQNGLIDHNWKAIVEIINKLSGPDFEFIKGKLLAIRENLPKKTREFIETMPTVELSVAHGDLQFDQIIADQSGNWRLIDLGGNPMLTRQEKMNKTLAIQDIGGMIRAFGFIKFFSLFNLFFENQEADSPEAAEKKSKADRQPFFYRRNVIYNAVYGTNLPVGEEKILGYNTEQIGSIVNYANIIEAAFAKQIINAYLDYLEQNNITSIIMPKWNRSQAKKMIEYVVLARALHELRYELTSRLGENLAMIPLQELIRSPFCKLEMSGDINNNISEGLLLQNGTTFSMLLFPISVTQIKTWLNSPVIIKLSLLVNLFIPRLPEFLQLLIPDFSFLANDQKLFEKEYPLEKYFQASTDQEQVEQANVPIRKAVKLFSAAGYYFSQLFTNTNRASISLDGSFRKKMAGIWREIQPTSAEALKPGPFSIAIALQGINKVHATYVYHQFDKPAQDIGIIESRDWYSIKFIIPAYLLSDTPGAEAALRHQMKQAMIKAQQDHLRKLGVSWQMKLEMIGTFDLFGRLIRWVVFNLRQAASWLGLQPKAQPVEVYYKKATDINRELKISAWELVSLAMALTGNPSGMRSLFEAWKKEGATPSWTALEQAVRVDPRSLQANTTIEPDQRVIILHQLAAKSLAGALRASLSALTAEAVNVEFLKFEGNSVKPVRIEAMSGELLTALLTLLRKQEFSSNEAVQKILGLLEKIQKQSSDQEYKVDDPELNLNLRQMVKEILGLPVEADLGLTLQGNSYHALVSQVISPTDSYATPVLQSSKTGDNHKSIIEIYAPGQVELAIKEPGFLLRWFGPVMISILRFFNPQWANGIYLKLHRLEVEAGFAKAISRSGQKTELPSTTLRLTLSKIVRQSSLPLELQHPVRLALVAWVNNPTHQTSAEFFNALVEIIRQNQVEMNPKEYEDLFALIKSFRGSVTLVPVATAGNEIYYIPLSWTNSALGALGWLKDHLPSTFTIFQAIEDLFQRMNNTFGGSA
jgi:hypothetical protein